MTGNINRIMISACRSGSGKTMLVMALLSALSKKNIRVRSFKCGPDYIDPMFHRKITGKPVYHLDSFFSDKSQLCRILSEVSSDSDISLIEGAMGFYDGIGTGTESSAYSVANMTETPVLLAIDPKGMGCSAGALCRGFLEYRKDNHISGVILNRIRSGMYSYYKRIIEENTGLKVYGFLPELEEINIKSRHLGLITADEVRNFRDITERLAETALRTLDIDKILELAGKAVPVEYKRPPEKNFFKKVRLGIAKDSAFCFYYPENLRMLEYYGAELVWFSPMTDKTLPKNLDGIYLGGGYPELYAEQLSRNISFKKSLKKAVENGIPVFAECGGFLYLQNQMTDNNKKVYSMTDILSGSSHIENHLVRFGYVTLTAQQDTLLLKKGESIKAHEFHYADTDNNGNALLAEKPDGRKWYAVQQSKNIMAGFPHLYFPSFPDAVKRFIEFMAEYRSEKRRSL